jgi:hypothetical protein
MNAKYVRKKRLYALKGRFGLSFGFFQVRRFTALSISGSSFSAAAGASAFSATGSGAAAGDASGANALGAGSSIGFTSISTVANDRLRRVYGEVCLLADLSIDFGEGSALYII